MTKRLWITLGILIGYIFALQASSPHRIGTDEVRGLELDSLVRLINLHTGAYAKKEIGQLSMEVYVKGTSVTTRYNNVNRLIPALLPYEPTLHPTAFEALCRVSYQAPSLLQVSPLTFRSNSRRGQKYLREIYQLLIPVYNIDRRRDDRKYILPFSDEGIEQYSFYRDDTTMSADQASFRIRFEPKKGDHHQLLTGEIELDAKSLLPARLTCSGKIDFGKFRMDMELTPRDSISVPKKAHIEIDYKYANSQGTNVYDCTYDVQVVNFHDIKREKHNSLDLTPIYKTDPLVQYNWDSIRTLPLTAQEDSLLSSPVVNTARRRKSLYQTLPERLVSGGNVNAFGTNLKIYGPLDPASLGYDKFNGVSISQKLRWSHLFHNGQSLLVRPVFGYNFGIKEARYHILAEWIYYPEKRCGLRFSSRNRNSGFSSKFVDVVNNALDSLNSHVSKFNDLGIEYYHHYETNLEQSVELLNGWMLYGGLTYHYRTPVKRGSRAMSKEHLDALVKDHYIDFNPYMRMEWTPRQYYHFEGRQKLYVASFYPRFSLEYSVSVPHVLGATSQYQRLEADVEQGIKLGPNKTLSYHVGAGYFFRQHGEYFVNYRYFSRSQRPDSWNDHIGGTFNLLDDYWYSSSPGYFQTHIMYESPFMLLNLLKPISKYVIRERVYLSNLYAKNKSTYTEVGYGMGNNYFNVGVFCGFTGLEYMDFGFKATLEIDQHW